MVTSLAWIKRKQHIIITLCKVYESCFNVVEYHTVNIMCGMSTNRKLSHFCNTVITVLVASTMTKGLCGRKIPKIEFTTAVKP